MIRHGVLHTIILLLLVLSAITGSASPIIVPEEEMRQSVIALNRARHRAVHELAQKKQSSTIEEREEKDYEKFMMYLTFRIGEYCQKLIAEHGEASINGLNCPSVNQTLFSGEASKVSTSQEQIEELKKLLTASLGQFDEELLKEEERRAKRQPKDRETGYGYGGSGKDGVEGGDRGTGETSGQGSGSSQRSDEDGMTGQERDKGKSGSTQTGTEAGGSASGTGEGAASGEGAGQGAGDEQAQGESSQSGTRELDTGYDDIVARQLREAAEKETDPELKKKLWEEYYKYKEGTR
jgi:hypothetical protein